MLEEAIRAIVKDEVEKMLRPLAEDISTYAEGNQKDLSALKELIQRNVIELQKVTVMIQNELQEKSPKPLPKQLVEQPKEKPLMKEPVKTVPYDDEKEEGVTYGHEEPEEAVVKPVSHLKGKLIKFKESESDEEAPEVEIEGETVEYPREWVKEQDEDMEKGGTQVWRFGAHTLTLWKDGKKQIAQVDDGEAEELWKQSQLEKIQKRIEKMVP